MAEMAEEKNSWETDIALIKADLKSMNKFFGRVENSIEMMGDLSKTVAVQHEVLKNTSEKLEAVEKLCEDTKRTDDLRMGVLSDRLEEYRRSAREDHQKLADHNAAKRLNSTKEILDRLDNIETRLNNKIDTQNKKIISLENWKYYMGGMGAVIMVLLAKINWPNLFG